MTMCGVAREEEDDKKDSAETRPWHVHVDWVCVVLLIGSFSFFNVALCDISQKDMHIQMYFFFFMFTFSSIRLHLLMFGCDVGYAIMLWLSNSMLHPLPLFTDWSNLLFSWPQCLPRVYRHCSQIKYTTATKLEDLRIKHASAIQRLSLK